MANRSCLVMFGHVSERTISISRLVVQINAQRINKSTMYNARDVNLQ